MADADVDYDGDIEIDTTRAVDMILSELKLAGYEITPIAPKVETKIPKGWDGSYPHD